MAKSTRDDNLAQDDDFLEDNSDWSDPVADNLPQDRGKPISRDAPKWKAIEEYWEKKRLQDALQDYLSEEE
jgi:sulfur relay (sulfurtransferase) DsrC/TusE family protein